MFKWMRRLLSLLVIGHLLYVFILKLIFPPITITQFNAWRKGEGLHRNYVPITEISTNVQWAVIAAEDQKFGKHKGFDVEAIKKIYQSGSAASKKRGGSTISQQVAKNVFLWQGKSWVRKGLEVYFTWLIELIWGKERILEVYLNVIEMGPGVFGVETCAQKNFKKSAAQLNLQEASKIAAALPNPKKYKIQPPSTYVLKRSQWIQKQVSQLKGTSELEQIILP